MEKVVLVPSDMSGKPITTSLTSTFFEPVKVVNLVDEIIINYDSESAEMMFNKIQVRTERAIREYGDAKYYIICGGAVVNSVLVFDALLKCGVDRENIFLLVWEKSMHRYIVFNLKGERAGDEYDRPKPEESEESGV